MANKILKVKNLKKYFPIRGAFTYRTIKNIIAVDDVSFSIKKGETLGLVGESGCGKTTIGRTILRLTEPTAGKIFFEGKNITNIRLRDFQKLRRNMQFVFQNPYASLNPRMRVKDLIWEPIIIHKLEKKFEKKSKIIDLINLVNLSKEHIDRYPHEFSGGQKQRIAIARAIALSPKLLILDEPTSALDVSVQAQILNLLLELKGELGLTYLFISHNLNVVKYISDRIAVMYAGRIVEAFSSKNSYIKFLHPYTKALFSANPRVDIEFKKELEILEGDVPNPSNLPTGCKFHPRCKFVKDICRKEEPKTIKVKKSHTVSCFLINQDFH